MVLHSTYPLAILNCPVPPTTVSSRTAAPVSSRPTTVTELPANGPELRTTFMVTIRSMLPVDATMYCPWARPSTDDVAAGPSVSTSSITTVFPNMPRGPRTTCTADAPSTSCM
ncbi:Os11g0644700 [Oryza sativa Japonica Group]|uniref:Os11g0644700 protein n=1 Tax=Oryza sativa subsp. japonica TaxID=39947 RepID=C7J907_ORYSJ|nr:Os11g0644700 [Oryza sativa Japonica Group]|eukprot:NP_001176679.1 Os11g0644700 [Oryza sativa Japonica Group]